MHVRPAFSHRDDRAAKAQERLQKKLKERQGVGGGGGVTPSKDSPPPSPQKSRGTPPAGDLQNGLAGKSGEEQAQHTGLGKSPPGRGKEAEPAGREDFLL